MASDGTLLRQLRNRWLDPPGQQLASEVIGRLMAGVSIDDLPLDKVDGRVDLRGLPVPRPVPVSGPRTVHYLSKEGIELTAQFANLDAIVMIENTTIENLDLSGAIIPMVKFKHTTINNCQFDHTDIEDFRLLASVLRNCSFVGAKVVGKFGFKIDDQFNLIQNVDFHACKPVKQQLWNSHLHRLRLQPRTVKPRQLLASQPDQMPIRRRATKRRLRRKSAEARG